MKKKVFMLRNHWRLVLKLAWGKQHYKAWREYPWAGWGLVLWIAFPFIWYYLIFPWLYYWFFDFFWDEEIFMIKAININFRVFTIFLS